MFASILRKKQNEMMPIFSSIIMKKRENKLKAKASFSCFANNFVYHETSGSLNRKVGKQRTCILCMSYFSQLILCQDLSKHGTDSGRNCTIKYRCLNSLNNLARHSKTCNFDK